MHAGLDLVLSHYTRYKRAIAGRSLIERCIGVDRFAMTVREIVENNDAFTLCR
jgi:hypothetical protein